MTPKQFRQARERIGLNHSEMARMLGISRVQVCRLEMDGEQRQRRPVMEPTRRLMQAYLDGYRPKDWPKPSQTKLSK